ncbi:hypothetical protein AMATHDRAFT_8427 [Amanita thiersii Skay4041]|uniref:Potassium transport protein n=1 Tax=Amanita thiersii Skay4041 TaxID=703135 RepID=A0A2A9N6X5_9AGAR|nr:hypothetical protein AMATHDRAFT_8427 [Amanita thiersii Skay4041]
MAANGDLESGTNHPSISRHPAGSTPDLGHDYAYVDNGTSTPGSKLNSDPPPSLLTRLLDWTTHALNYAIEEINFFRIHLFAFVIIPLIASIIFYASNGRFHVKYVDALFLCYSAMTVTGLTTVNMSTVTAWQQVMLYLLMVLGNVTTVSWLMVLARKHFFQRKCEYIVQRRPPHRSRTAFIDWLTSNQHAIAENIEHDPPKPSITIHHSPLSNNTENRNDHVPPEEETGLIAVDGCTFTSSPRGMGASLPPIDEDSPMADYGFTTATSPVSHRLQFVMPPREGVPNPISRRNMTILSHRDTKFHSGIPNSPTSQKYRDFGGLPGPLELANKALRRAVPSVHKTLQRKMTVSYMQTLKADDTPWLKFDGLVVGRNSDFHTEELSDEELEKIGGQEYRALRFLSYLIPVYFVVVQLVAFLIFGPWISVTKTYDEVFQAQPRLVNKTWFSVFQVMSAYTGGGISLVDQGMVPFQRAYIMIFPLMFAILAGNHAMPIFLRLFIWIGTALAQKTSDLYDTLSFLMDHPRRCYTYMFPSHQTWFLVICLVLFSIIEWVAFEVFNIGLEVYESIPVGVRTVAGLFQGIAARASGFSIVPVASFAPSIQFLYVVMMYIAVYPIAMSIRSTNVYEERSLGVYQEPTEEESAEEPENLGLLGRRERIGRYLSWHLRRQMSIDIWWLVWGILLVAIIERNNLLDENKKWFDMFRIVFELVSAFGGIGFSLGVPYDNFSFSGAMRPLSRLVIIVLMVRGRHRGLPVAVDRAVLLPHELVTRSSRNKKSEVAPVSTQPQPCSDEQGLDLLRMTSI